MLEASDLDGYSVWKRVVRAVEELQSVRALHACLRLSGCDLLFTVDSVNEEGDRAKNDGREVLGTGIVLAGASGGLAP